MSEQSQTIFSEGFIFKRPKEGVPAYVKGSMSVKVSEAIAFLQKHQNNDWVNLDLLASKDNTKLYFKLNTYKPPVTAPAPVAQQAPSDIGLPDYPVDEIKPADIPF